MGDDPIHSFAGYMAAPATDMVLIEQAISAYQPLDPQTYTPAT